MESSSYRGVLKSTSLIGAASLINILIGMVRTKFVAILLGPIGIGLLGLYNQIIAVTSTATGLGIGNSGVRQVAEAVGTGDDEQIARTIITLRRTAWVTGIFGMSAMIVLCAPISHITFGSTDYALQIAFLGITLLFASIAAGQACVLRGTRRIADVAKITVISALCSTLISIPCFYLWGVQGVVPSLILSSISVLVTSWWYARKVIITTPTMSWQEIRKEAHGLLTLGFSFMGAGLVSSISIYAIQALIIRQFSLADFGIYQAAYSLSGVLVGFVLGAMGADYYPRLTAVAEDNASVYRIVNEQSQISILLALPGLAAMMVFAPLIIQLFYSDTFTRALPILQWCTLGMLGRVVSWPLGFVLLAKGMGRFFFMTETFFCGVHFAGVFFFTRIWGLNGAGIAFLVLYIVCTGLLLYVMKRLIGGAWSRSTLQVTFSATAVMVVLLLNCALNKNALIAWISNLTILGLVSFLCLRQLARKSGIGITAFLAAFDKKKESLS